MRTERLAPNSKMLFKDSDSYKNKGSRLKVVGFYWTVQHFSDISHHHNQLDDFKSTIAGSASKCFRFGRYEMRSQDLYFKQVPVTLMLLVQGPLFENYLDSIRITTSHV